MSQYERIVSYIYRYNEGEKGANVGFAKIEKRGSICRISVQMREVQVNCIPQVYLFRQLEDGIHTIYVGPMVARGSNLLCKASSDATKLFQTYESIDDIEGIFIYVERQTYFATSWKNDTFYLGNWNKDGSDQPTNTQESENHEKVSLAKNLESNTSEAESDQMISQESEVISQTTSAEKEMRIETSVVESEPQEMLPEADAELRASENSEVQNAEEDIVIKQECTNLTKEAEEVQKNVRQKDIQMQSICGVCPFKRKALDYGKKILMTFPSMKPFEPGVAKACVRMELQDIGCLPIASWSLSGNRFLLHGYYCYRHLIFAQLEDGQYVLGVPGIYSDKEKSNAIRFGFSKFQSIGSFGQKQGAFGYWMLVLPEGI